ncbi:hypothetical protein J5X84_07700 [Streptosporangiaceae bacterium NEAU-GS5]|nr:hypothetical protein [Streptosporangiaceae bacterium NEAU-GS5]
MKRAPVLVEGSGMKFIPGLTRHISRYERGPFAAKIVGSYLLIVIAATVYVEVATRQPHSQGLEGIVLFAVTSPTSQLLIFLPLDALPQPLSAFLLFPAAGFFQGWLLWLIARGRVRKDSSSEHAPTPM